MDIANKLKMVMTAYNFSSEKIAEVYKAETNESISSRSIRRYSTGATQPSTKIAEGLEKALSSLLPNTDTESVFTKGTDKEKYDLHIAFENFLETYSETLEDYYDGTCFNVNYVKDFLVNVFEVYDIPQIDYFLDNLNDISTLEPFEIKICDRFRQLSSRDQDDILHSLSQEHFQVSKALKQPNYYPKVASLTNMINISEHKPRNNFYDPDSSWRYSHEHIDEIDPKSIKKLVKVGMNSRELFGFTPKDWYFLSLLQNLKLNDSGINYVTDEESSNPAIIGDKMATLIFYIEKRLHSQK